MEDFETCGMNNGHYPSWKRAKWFSTLLARACEHTTDGDVAFRAASMALEVQPIPEEGELAEKPQNRIKDAYFAHDIFNPRAQSILNKAIHATKKMSATARRELTDILKSTTPQIVAHKLETWAAKYRTEMARILSTTQLASLLAGMRQVAAAVPPSPLPGGFLPGREGGLPASLQPEDALELFEKIKALPEAEQQQAIYELPPDQQAFVRTAIQAEQAQPPEIPPLFPEAPPGSPEPMHWPIIDEAARLLKEKNLVTRQEFDNLDDASRAKAFTVAGVSSRETLDKIREVMSESIRTGVDFKDFQEKVMEEVEPATFLSDAHMETVYRTNVQAAFTDGANKILEHPFIKSGFPYAAYEPIHDDRVREEHLELENYGIGGSNIYRRDDPTFQKFQPPWDYNCRCSWIPLSVRMAAEKGVQEAKSWLARGTPPAEPAFVSPPPFEPPAEFKRELNAAPLSIQLSATPITDWEKEDSDHLPAPDLSPIMAAPGTITGDNATKHKGKKGRSLGKKKKLPKGRLPKAWQGIKLSWSPFQGPQGGRGWKSSVTGEVRYQSAKPSEAEEGQKPQTEQKPSAQPAVAQQNPTALEKGQKFFNPSTETTAEVVGSFYSRSKGMQMYELADESGEKWVYDPSKWQAVKGEEAFAETPTQTEQVTTTQQPAQPELSEEQRQVKTVSKAIGDAARMHTRFGEDLADVADAFRMVQKQYPTVTTKGFVGLMQHLEKKNIIRGRVINEVRDLSPTHHELEFSPEGTHESSRGRYAFELKDYKKLDEEVKKYMDVQRIIKTIEATLSWEPYTGPSGGRGWVNHDTGQIRYQTNKPSDEPTSKPTSETVHRKIKHFLGNRNEYTFDHIRSIVAEASVLSGPELNAVATSVMGGLPANKSRKSVLSFLGNWLADIKQNAEQTSFELKGGGQSKDDDKKPPSSAGHPSKEGSESKGVSVPKDETELHQKASEVAEQVITKSGGIAKMGAAGKWLWTKTVEKYKKLEARYGRKTTLAIVGASIITFPIPLNITAIIGLAELYRKLSKSKEADMSVWEFPNA